MTPTAQQAFAKLSGPGKPLRPEAADAAEFADLIKSAMARLDDADNPQLSIESRLDLACNAAHALCMAALRWHGWRSGNR